VGPRPFGPEDRERFFGREREARDTVSLIIAHRVLLIYALSGAGKTSLVNAGIVPLLEREGFEVLPRARLRGEMPQGMAPEESPTNLYVFNTLVSWAGPSADPRQLAPMSFAGYLRGLPRLKDERGNDAPRVAIFDQFEELFTFAPERWQDRRGFFEQLDAALEENPLLRVVLVLREDFLAQLDPYAGLLPERLRTRFRVELLRRAGALEAVTRPLEHAEPKRSFAPGVAEQLVEDLLRMRFVGETGRVAEAEGEFVEPVQLQVVCRNLWQRLPREVLEISRGHLYAFGNVDQALREFYEGAVRQAARGPSISERRLRRWVEEKLITQVGTRGTVNEGQQKTAGIPNSVVQELENQHLIRGEDRAGARWYELTHDRLIEPIRESNKAWRKTWEAWRSALATACAILSLVAVLWMGFAVIRKEQRTVMLDTVIARLVETSTYQARRVREGTVFVEREKVTATAEAQRLLEATRRAQSQEATATAQALRGVRSQGTAEAMLTRGALAAESARILALHTVEAKAAAAAQGADKGAAAKAAQELDVARATATAAPQGRRVRPVVVNLRLPADMDTYLSEESPKHGHGEDPPIVVSAEVDKNASGLLRFDLGQLPPEAQILEATLSLGVVSVRGPGEVHLAVGPVECGWEDPIPWGEMTTYSQALSVGLRRGEPSVPLVVAREGQGVRVDVSSIVRDWREGHRPDCGFMLDVEGRDGRGGLGCVLASSQWITALERPALEVSYIAYRELYPAPRLLWPKPGDKVQGATGEGMDLKWSWGQGLDSGEAFWVTVWPEGQDAVLYEPPVEAAECTCKRAWWPPESGDYLWYVVVKNRAGLEVSARSEVGRFSYVKPEG
jgi:hypothetical protein